MFRHDERVSAMTSGVVCNWNAKLSRRNMNNQSRSVRLTNTSASTMHSVRHALKVAGSSTRSGDRLVRRLFLVPAAQIGEVLFALLLAGLNETDDVGCVESMM